MTPFLDMMYHDAFLIKKLYHHTVDTVKKSYILLYLMAG